MYLVTTSNTIKVIFMNIFYDANKIYMEMQAGDVLRTYADIKDLEKEINFKPNTSIEQGLSNFVNWYREYYKK